MPLLVILLLAAPFFAEVAATIKLTKARARSSSAKCGPGATSTPFFDDEVPDNVPRTWRPDDTRSIISTRWMVRCSRSRTIPG